MLPHGCACGAKALVSVSQTKLPAAFKETEALPIRSARPRTLPQHPVPNEEQASIVVSSCVALAMPEPAQLPLFCTKSSKAFKAPIISAVLKLQ